MDATAPACAHTHTQLLTDIPIGSRRVQLEVETVFHGEPPGAAMDDGRR